MKHLFTAAILIVSVSSCAIYRPIPIENGKLAGILPMYNEYVYYETVVKLPDVPAETIYRQARRYVAYRTIDPKAPFHTPDNLNRDIIGPGRLEATIGIPETERKAALGVPATNYTVSVECFPGKYRLAFTSFRELNGLKTTIVDYGSPIEAPTFRSLNHTKQYFRRIDERVLAITDDIKEFIAEESKLR